LPGEMASGNRSGEHAALLGEKPNQNVRDAPILSYTGRAITGLRLYRRTPLYARVDVMPFGAAYSLLLAVWIAGSLSRFALQVALATTVSLHILAFLVQHWSVTIRAAMSWSRISALDEDVLDTSPVYALAHPRTHRGKAELVPLQRGYGGRIFFSFQKRTYEYNAPERCFEKVTYPTRLPLSHYANIARASHGLEESGIEAGYARFGQNRLEMPSPSFSELYIESLLAPFFVFQVFCILLWMLDEYWHYSLMTLFMMLVFEATVVSSRLRSLRELRGMRNKPRNVFVYRKKKWLTITSLELLPGDILSVPRSQNPEDVVPCDLLILAGTVVVNEAMLTGESVPLMKEAAMPLQPADLNRPLAVKDNDKNHVLFGGTRVLTHTSPGTTDATPSTRPPDNGCICYVLRTGFGSSQGKLMRTILFSTDTVSANSKEAALFIVFLLVFAIAASGYVLANRYSNDADSRYKLLLRCVLIITSVVPPELPMQLSLAVNTSLIALAKSLIFCTEPFRIPFAGKVDVCCFDKTGTITTDSIHAAGVALPPDAESTFLVGPSELSSIADEKQKIVDSGTDESASAGEFPMIPVARASSDAALVLASCHSLVHVDNDLIGDPLELAGLEAVEWAYGRSGTAVPKRGGASALSSHIVHRFRFASALQRMSVIVEVSGTAAAYSARVLCKGSPEAISKLCCPDGLPPGYAETASGLSRRGLRVLALASKVLKSGMTSSQLQKISREDAERDLKFAGFVCFECPLRQDSRKVIRMLKRSSHDVMMITGDATLTAAHVARQVSMCTRSMLILERSEVVAGSVEWFSAATGKRRKKYSAAKIPELASEYDLCVSGSALDLAVELDNGTTKFLRHIKVFARMSPSQKERVLTALKEVGLYTLMCGDGTNDVGALKQAHVGVALLSSNVVLERDSESSAEAPEVDAMQIQAVPSTSTGRNTLRRRRHTSQKSSHDSSGRLSTPAGGAASRDANGAAEMRLQTRTVQEEQTDEFQRRVQALTGNLEESDDQAPLVKLGDASIASPFTSRRMTIDSCVTIIRQGRCTLATTMQMYQILALNCLISAYSLSVLYLDGVAFGDKQMTVTGIILAIAFFLISRSKPLKKLSAQRPATSIFAPELFISLLGQFAIHVTVLLFCTRLAKRYIPFGPMNNVDSEFRPSVMNTIVFLLSIAQQVSVFVVNYKGRPFMQGLTDNRALLNCLLAVGGIVLTCTAEISPDLNEFMELSPWPDRELQIQVAGYICLDFVSALVWDKIIVRICHPGVNEIL
jgi:manganese-transporting P-type ATPase